jgi:hypothetical protein
VTNPSIVERQLALARQSLTPSTQLRERVHAGLLASSAATRGASVLALTQLMRSDSPWAALRSSGRFGVMLGAGLLALGFGSGYWLRPSPVEPPPLPRPPVVVEAAAEVRLLPDAIESPSTESSSTESSSAGATPDAAPALPPAAAVRLPARVAHRARLARKPAHGQAIAAAPDVGPTLGPSDELALLQRAERAVRADQPALALALTAELDERYAQSRLLQERHAIALMAACEAAAGDASERAASFLREYPKSVYAPRIRELCLSEPSPRPQR